MGDLMLSAAAAKHTAAMINKMVSIPTGSSYASAFFAALILVLAAARAALV